ncbi:MAG TPA: hypothetical protein VNI02_25130 [Blastocatellia bacterium]|jgi:hypothetical protein|nr:hypothetical protein [Blastocatellia bacterium]
MKDSPPSAQEWKSLYEAAIEFQKIQCWNWMYDSDIFGVQNPETGEIGYCCVMGNLGQMFALAVYLGTDGLDGYLMIQSGELATGDADTLYVQRCLMASFEDRGELNKTDLKSIKDAGLKFRGRKSWPLIRSYRPGYFPWYLTGDEARFLTVAFEQAVDVALRFKEDRHLLDHVEPNLYLVRVPEKHGGQLIWRDERLEPAPVEEEAVPVKAVDEIRLHQIKQAGRVHPGTWEVDFFYAPMPVAKEGRPYFPPMMVCVDHNSSLILNFHLATPPQHLSEFQDKILETFERTKALPQRVLVQKKVLFDLLQPITGVLGVKLSLVESLDATEDVRSSLFQMSDGEFS